MYKRHVVVVVVISFSFFLFFFLHHLIIAFSLHSVVREALRDFRRLKSLVTWFQSETPLQETRQTRLRTRRVTSWNCGCQLQIALLKNDPEPFCLAAWFHHGIRDDTSISTCINQVLNRKDDITKSFWRIGQLNVQVVRLCVCVCVCVREREWNSVFNQASGPWNSHFFAQFEQLNSISRRTFFKHRHFSHLNALRAGLRDVSCSASWTSRGTDHGTYFSTFSWIRLIKLHKRHVVFTTEFKYRVKSEI